MLLEALSIVSFLKLSGTLTFIALIYCCLVENLYRYSSFSVICGFELSKEFKDR